MLLRVETIGIYSADFKSMSCMWLSTFIFIFFIASTLAKHAS